MRWGDVKIGRWAAAFTIAAFFPAAAASATTGDTDDGLADVAAALRADPVYVDDDAERAIGEADLADVREAIAQAGTPVYLAVLPSSATDGAGGDPAEVARLLAQAVGRQGTYGVVVGDSFRAGSSELPAGMAADLARGALEAGGDDTAAVLVAFVDRVSDASSESAVADNGAEPAGASAGDDSGDGAGWIGPVLVAGGVGAGGLLWWRSRQRRAERQRAEAADRELIRAELSVLASDVVDLEDDVRLHPAAQSDFDAAVNRYRAAQAAIDHADEPVDLVRVERVVAEARYSMDRARAIVQGREPPPPPDDLQRPGRHGEPAVTIGDDREPVYVGYPGGYGGGWFGGPGGLFSGMLLGSMLFGPFGGWGHGGTTIINDLDGGDGGGGDFGGGDFGGGDFGGGDFGGGDFGGGDFGGGDFGGGDF